MIIIVNIKSYNGPASIIDDNDLFAADLKSQPYYELYIGRTIRLSVLRNIFLIGRDGNRKTVIEKYKVYLKDRYNNDKLFRGYLHKLAELSTYKILILICHCKPLACHGDVVKEALESIIKHGEWR